jgi:hypothetical protein
MGCYAVLAAKRSTKLKAFAAEWDLKNAAAACNAGL